MAGSYGMTEDLKDVDVWVMAPPTALMRLKNLEGVATASPFYRGTAFIKGKKWTVMGIDESSRLGLPGNLKEGKLQHLSLDGAVIVNQKNSRLKVGNLLQIGKMKAVVVGLYNSSKEPVIYTTLERAEAMSQATMDDLPFLLVKAKEGVTAKALCQKIHKATGFKAFTKGDFLKMITLCYLQTSRIPSHFAWAIILGFCLALGIICTTLISVCERLKGDLALFRMIGATPTIILTIGLVHSLSVCLLGFFCGFLFSVFFFFSWKVTLITFLMILWMGSIVPLIFMRSSYDRMYSTL